jgi:hypothetical protein
MARTLLIRLLVLTAMLVQVGCNDEDKGLDPSLVTPEVVTSVATMAAASSVVLTGRVKPNGSRTICYFEFGTSPLYGERTKDLDIGSGSAYVEFRDTLLGLAPATTYHYRAVGSSSAGLRTGPDSVFVTATSPPTIVSVNAVSTTPNSLLLVGTVRPNGLPAVCYFEYGTSPAYGQRTKDIDIGSGNAHVEFRDSLQGLVPGTTYHVRVVASSTDGQRAGSDLVVATLAESVFPTKVGTQWNYTYSSYSSPNSYPVYGGIVTDRRASMIWTIGSTSKVNDSLICRIDLTGVDTVRTTHYEYGLIVSDSTHIAPLQGQWRMVHYRDQVIMNWYATLVPSYPYDQSIPRSAIESADTLKISGFQGFGKEYYVKGVGLARYTWAHATQTGHSSLELRLTSWSSP